MALSGLSSGASTPPGGLQDCGRKGLHWLKHLSDDSEDEFETYVPPGRWNQFMGDEPFVVDHDAIRYPTQHSLGKFFSRTDGDDSKGRLPEDPSWMDQGDFQRYEHGTAGLRDRQLEAMAASPQLCEFDRRVAREVAVWHRRVDQIVQDGVEEVAELERRAKERRRAAHEAALREAEEARRAATVQGPGPDPHVAVEQNSGREAGPVLRPDRPLSPSPPRVPIKPPDSRGSTTAVEPAHASLVEATAVSNSGKPAAPPRPIRPPRVLSSATSLQLLEADRAVLLKLTNQADYMAWKETELKKLRKDQANRKIAQKINVLLNGLSGNTQGIQTKSQALVQELTAHSGPAGVEAMVAFATKVRYQCMDMVATQPAFAFTLAAAVHNVVQHVPQVAAVVLGSLKGPGICPLCVPQWTNFAGDMAAWQEANGFRKSSEGGYESVDNYLLRVTGFMRFYGALLYFTDIKRAWQYCATVANALPANKYTATALIAFLESVGHGMSQEFGQQFRKLMYLFAHDWAVQLRARGDAAAEVSRLDGMWNHGFQDPPEGLDIPDEVVDREKEDEEQRQHDKRSGGRGYRGRGGRRY